MTHHRRRLVALVLVAAAGCATTPEAAPTTGGPATGPVPASTSTTTEPTTTTSTSTLPPPPPPTAATTAAPAPRPAPPPPAPASGPRRSGRATHYRLESSGNCSFPDGGGADRMYVAMNATDYGTADLCGAYLAVQGNTGSVTVKVVDQCPECPPGALDLSPEAFARVTRDAGITNVQWQVVSGPAQPAVTYRIKEGSSQWWVGILPMHHRNPVRSLEALVGGRWVALERQEYNYFLAPGGLGPGPFDVRLTDTFGERIESPGLTPQAGRVIATGQQFAGH